jgi:hypothetical protein
LGNSRHSDQLPLHDHHGPARHQGRTCDHRRQRWRVRGTRDSSRPFDVDTGKELWKFYTVPGDPSKPFEQPIYAEWAKTWDASKKWWVAGGGGPVWGSIAYDPDEDLVYVGTGQPGPWSSAGRGPGDDLCTDCIIAVKGATGKYVWHYQTTPGDDWDYDSIADITLADLKINGKNRKVLMHAPKNGFFFVIDRVTGEFISAEPWVTVSWALGMDPKTGRAIVNPAARSGPTPVNVIPGPAGGHVWPPQSYSPLTGLVYIPSTTGTGYSFSGDPNYVIVTSEIREGERGRMQMGDAPRGGGGGGGRGGAAGARRSTRISARGSIPTHKGLPPGAAPPAAAGAGAGGGGRGGAGGAGGGGRGRWRPRSADNWTPGTRKYSRGMESCHSERSVARTGQFKLGLQRRRHSRNCR